MSGQGAQRAHLISAADVRGFVVIEDFLTEFAQGRKAVRSHRDLAALLSRSTRCRRCGAIDVKDVATVIASRAAYHRRVPTCRVTLLRE
jgi:hypothetical protein